MEKDKDYFRVPCEFQMRSRVVDEQERELFKTVSVRPSASLSLRSEVEGLLRGSQLDESLRSVVDYGFALLLNMDQRLERIEEEFSLFVSGQKEKIQQYQWVSADLGAEGLWVPRSVLADAKEGDFLLMDILLPSMPEQRLVATLEWVECREGQAHLLFDGLHKEDEEYLFRFIRSREREILRSRKK